MNGEAPGGEGTLSPVGLLALCPLLAAADTFLSALCLAAAFLAVLVMVRSAAAWLGAAVATELRVIALFLITGTCVTAVDFALQAWLWPVRDALGFYVPLLAANALVLASAEQALRGPAPAHAPRTGFRLGLVVAAWLVPLGLVRELLGRGGVLTDTMSLGGWPGSVTFGAPVLPLLQEPAGALLLLALAAAFVATATGPETLR